MRTGLIGLAAAGCAILGLAGCGGSTTTTTTNTATATTTPTSASTPNVPQLGAAFKALLATTDTALAAVKTQAQTASTYEQAKTLVGEALNIYLAFDSGLQRLNLPTSMNADVTAQLHADAQVEAAYQNAMSDTSLLQMQSTLSSVGPDLNIASAATITLQRDLGLLPTQ